MQPGDLVKIVLSGGYNDERDVIMGTVLKIQPQMPHVSQDSMQQPAGPIFEVQILQTCGSVWDSWIDQRDKVEIL